MREIINLSTAGRLRGVTRQRISELYLQGRFTVPTDDNGEEIKNAVYLDEVEHLTGKKRGRPPLPQAEREERGLDMHEVGQRVIWHHTPRDGYGFAIDIESLITKVANKKVLLEFSEADGKKSTAWVSKECIIKE